MFVIKVVISLLRVLLFLTRPRTLLLGNIPGSMAYRSTEQYPSANNVPGILILRIESPIYFTNSNYLRERYTMLVWFLDFCCVNNSLVLLVSLTAKSFPELLD